MDEFDDAVVRCFLKKQRQLFPENVAETPEEWEFFEEEGIDTEGMKGDDILKAEEVFDVGDGRYLIVEG